MYLKKPRGKLNILSRGMEIFFKINLLEMRSLMSEINGLDGINR